MLVLSRRHGEKIVITLPDKRQISVLVNRICGDRVSLAIDAPVDVVIRRGELKERAA